MQETIHEMNMKDDDYARVCLEALLTIGLDRGEKAVDRIKAISMVLLMTKKRPEHVDTIAVSPVRDVRSLLEAKKAEIEQKEEDE